MISANSTRTAARAVTTLVLVACSSAPESRISSISEPMAMSAHAANATGLTAEQNAAIARVRAATSRFQQIAAAQAAGYTAQYPAGCAQSSAGAQGFHYLNPALVDANVELLRPELVMYEPGSNGQMQLVGVDYVVPFNQWPSETGPTLLGVPFMRNEPLGVWALHIWAWRPNPSGMFAMWNPSVSCALAR